MLLIGLSGKKQSGKNTVAKIIAANSRLPVVELAFGDALKDEVCKALHISRSYLEEHKSNFRLILQGWGTDYKRKLISDDYWVQILMKKLLVQDDNCVCVITDVRFSNEYKLIREIHGHTVRVIRFEQEIDEHKSETELDNVSHDTIIHNNKDYFNLVLQVRELLTKLKIPLT